MHFAICRCLLGSKGDLKGCVICPTPWSICEINCGHWWQPGQAARMDSILWSVSVSVLMMLTLGWTVLRMQTLFLGLYVYNVIVVLPAAITVVDYSSLSMLALTEGDSSCLILLMILSRLVLLAISLLARESDVKKLSMMTSIPLPVKQDVWDASARSLSLVEQGLSMLRKCVQRVFGVHSLMPNWFLLAVYWANWHRHVIWHHCSSTVMFLPGLKQPMYFCTICSKWFSCHFSLSKCTNYVI